MGVGGVMVAAVRMGFGRATRWSIGGRAWASSLAAGMVLAGAAVLLLAWSVEPAGEAPPSDANVREVDFDDPARIIVTADDPTIFDAPLRPAAPRTTVASDAAPPRGTSSGTRGGSDRAPRPATGGTSAPTPTPTTSTPTPTTPAPTTGGGTTIGGGSIPDPGTTPTPTPNPPAGGSGSSGIKVTVNESTTTLSVGAGIDITSGRSSGGTIVSATVQSPSTSTTMTTNSTTTTSVSAGTTSATVSTSTSTATVTAGGITLTVPLLGTVTG